MTLNPAQRETLDTLLFALRDDELTQSQAVELEQLVLGHAEAMQHYLRIANLSVGLRWIAENNDECEVPPDERGLGTSVPSVLVIAPTITNDHFVSAPDSSFIIPQSAFPSSFVGGLAFSYLMAAVILGTALAVAWIWKLPDAPQFAGQSPLPPAKQESTPEPAMQFVGRITGMIDCEWSDPNTAVPGPVAVPLGRKYALSSGLMEITYSSGAKVILQGPVTYEVESASGGYLSVGKLTARLEKRAEGGGRKAEATIAIANDESEIINQKSASALHLPPSTLFSVRTPTATVTDLGTEFGVEVAESGDTSARVFQGVVEVRMASDDGKPQQSVRLTENESAHVKRCGVERITLLGPAARAIEFVRELPERKIKSFDLVDAVAGGNGFGQTRNRGIDPATGQISHAAPSTFLPAFPGDRAYHRVEGVPFVDGVFIPDGSASPVLVDSAGHAFEGFAKTDNLTYGHIWAGGPIAMADSPKAICTTLFGLDDYATPGHGLLLIHANGGITFDLNAIRRATGGGRIVRFRAVGGNAATMAETVAAHADLWVLVDGKQRFVRRRDAGRVGPVLVDVPIKETDGFLTVAFTDGGDGCGWDWTILGDPRLDIVVTEAKQPQPSPAKP